MALRNGVLRHGFLSRIRSYGTQAQDHTTVLQQEFARQASRIESGSKHIFRASVPWIIHELESQKIIPAQTASGSKSLLEVAAGTSILSRALASRVRNITAVDVTTEMLEAGKASAAKEGISNIAFDLGNAENLSYPARAFDIVLTRWSFHHMPRYPLVAAEMGRVVKEGGHVVVVDIESPPTKVVADRMNYLERLRDPSHVRFPTEKEMRRVFADSGLDVVHRAEYEEEKRMDDWFALASTPTENREPIRLAFAEEAAGKARHGTGLRAKLAGDGTTLMFTHRSVMTVGVPRRK